MASDFLEVFGRLSSSLDFLGFLDVVVSEVILRFHRRVQLFEFEHVDVTQLNETPVEGEACNKDMSGLAEIDVCVTLILDEKILLVVSKTFFSR